MLTLLIVLAVLAGLAAPPPEIAGQTSAFLGGLAMLAAPLAKKAGGWLVKKVGGALANKAVGAVAGGIAGGAAGAYASRQSDEEKEAVARMSAATDAVGARAGAYEGRENEMRGRYLGLLEGFNPGEYASRTAGAIGSQVMEDYGRAEGARKVGLQRRGFMPGSTLGSGRLAKDFNERLARQMAALSMQTAGMEQDRIGEYGDVYGQDRAYTDRAQGDYLDLLAGGRDYEMMRRQDRTGAILSGAATGAGLVLRR